MTKILPLSAFPHPRQATRRITIDLVDTERPGLFETRVHFDNVPGGAATVHEALLTALHLTVKELGRANAPAMYLSALAVVREIAKDVIRQAPVVEVAQEMPQGVQ